MKLLSDNLLLLVFAFVLGLSPVQSIAASVSNCMTMDHSMHAQMKDSDAASSTDMQHSGNTTDCCNQNECGTSHCASATVATIASNNFNDISYTLSTVYQKPNSTLISFYSSSLYRPPKI